MKRLAFTATFTLMCIVAFSQTANKRQSPTQFSLGSWIYDPGYCSGLNTLRDHTVEYSWASGGDTLTVFDPTVRFIKIDNNVFEIIRSVSLTPVVKTIEDVNQWQKGGIIPLNIWRNLELGIITYDSSNGIHFQSKDLY